MADTKLVICEKCLGTGHVNGGNENSTWSKTCEDCHGIGFSRVQMNNADRIRSMDDEELAEFLTGINPTNCQDCAFSHGWRCKPDRDDYYGFEKCKEGRKRWLQRPAE